MRREEVTKLGAILANLEARELAKDCILTIDSCRKVESQIYANFRDYHYCYRKDAFDAVEAQMDVDRAQKYVNTGYDIARYECIEGINDILGENLVNMNGTDKQVCMRFYNLFKQAGLLSEVRK